MRRIRIIISVILFSLFFVSCSMLEKERAEGSSVSFKLDSQTVQKIKAAAGETGGAAASRSARAADSESAEKIFIELAVHGGFEKATVVEVTKEATITIDNIPMDSEIYLEATAYINVDGERQNLYKGHSKKFIVRNSENFVMFILHRVSSDDDSEGDSSGTSGGSSGNGSGGNGGNGGNSGSSNFAINIASGISNGSVSANVSTSAGGTEISLTVNPASGYKIETLTVTGADNSTVTINRNNGTRKFTMPSQNVTVNATFKAVPYTILSAGTNGSVGTTGTYAIFGEWPQTLKASSVTVDENDATAVTEDHGAFTYYKGSDDAWYVKLSQNACDGSYYYSDGVTTVGQNGSTSKWFKVEPIKWRVVTRVFDHDQDNSNEYADLLLCESILVGLKYYDQTQDPTVMRTIEGNDVYPTNYEHSKVRAYLNGYSYELKETTTSTQTTSNTHLNKGILQTAFTTAEQNSIATTKVDNSEASMSDSNGNLPTAPNYICSDTLDKLFLLSEKEVTTAAYGFLENDGTGYEGSGQSDTARVRKPTDFALASGAFYNSSNNCGAWWLRSPDDYSQVRALCVSGFGASDNYDESINRDNEVGIVPALCIY